MPKLPDATKEIFEIEDNEKCPECGHIGLVHLREEADLLQAGCTANINTGSIFPRRCGCLIRRKNK